MADEETVVTEKTTTTRRRVDDNHHDHNYDDDTPVEETIHRGCGLPALLLILNGLFLLLTF